MEVFIFYSDLYLGLDGYKNQKYQVEKVTLYNQLMTPNQNISAMNWIN